MSSRAWSRRDFLLLGGGALTLAATEGLWGTDLRGVVRPGVEGGRYSSTPQIVRMGCILPAGDTGRGSGTGAGVLLGAEESEQVGALLGVELDLQVERVEGLEEAEAAGARLMAAGVQVLVGAMPPPTTRPLSRMASRAGILFVDAGASSVAPSTATDAVCASPLFRVGVDPATGLGLVLEALALEAQTTGVAEGFTTLVGDPGDPQLSRGRTILTRLGQGTRIVDAATPDHVLSDELRSLTEGDASGPTRVLLVGPAALSRVFRPGAVGTAHRVFATTPLQPGGPRPVVPVHAPALWHPGLIRFGAAQLNERHERRFGTPMDPSAWAGWFVVKLLWEVTLREGTGRRGGSLGERLVDPATRFDGHKGAGIGFRSDGLLRQPLYLVRTDPDGGSEVVHEGPVAPRETPFATAFDSLGPAESPCRGRGVDSPSPLPSGPRTSVPSSLASTRSPSPRGLLPGSRVAPLFLAILLLLSPPALQAQSPSPSQAPLVFVTNEISGDITVIDSGTDEVVRTIPVGSRPRGIRVSPDGGTVSVALSGYTPEILTEADVIVSVDVASGEIIRRYDAGTDPETFDLSPDGRTLFISNEDAGTATVVDVETGEIQATLSVGVEPEGVAASPDGRWVYVTAESSNTVAVIDARTRTVVHAFMVDARPRSAAFSPDSRRAYVTNEIGGVLSVVDVEGGHQVIHTIDLAGGESKPVGVVVSPDGHRIYVANGHAHSVSVIDAATLEEIEQIPVGRRPWGIAITPSGDKLYTANGLSNDVTVIDTRTGDVLSTIRVGNKPWGVAIQP